MALVLRWYDAGCFAVVGVAVLGSLWIVFRREKCGGRGEAEDAGYETLSPLPVASRKPPVPGGHRGCGSCLWTTCWRGLHPGWLLLIRLVLAGASVGILFWDLRKYDYLIFVYYTEWTFVLVIFYFALATLVSACGCWNYLGQSSIGMEESDHLLKMNSLPVQVCDSMEQSTGILGRTMQIVYQTCAGAVMLTDVVFWCVIVPFLDSAHFTLNLLMGCMHTLNLVFLLLDSVLNNMPFPMFRMAYFVLFTSTYAIFQWILHACGFSWWPYPFLDLSIPWAPLCYFVVALVHVPCYGFYFLLVKAKYTFFPRLFPNAFIKLC